MPESFDDLPVAPEGQTPEKAEWVQHCANCGLGIVAAPPVERHGKPHLWRHAAGLYRACRPWDARSEWAQP